MLDNTRQLPAQSQFFSSLRGSSISDSDYIHAAAVWDKFQCQSLRDYTELYVRADSYQLAEAIFNMRDVIMAEFKVDLCHYLSLPMMSKDIMLKYTECEMALLHDLEMINFFKSNIRGGLSFVNQRHFDKIEESTKRQEDISLAYVDANNLYGAAMRFAMPVGEYRWMSDQEIETICLDDISAESETGYVFEVTLEYPPELHLSHSSFPMAPHQQDITADMLSDYAKNALQTLTRKTKYNAKKLTSSFLRREKYTCHALNLKLYVQHGMKLVTMHRGVAFRQEKFLKPYIDLCTRQRAESKTKAQKDVWKLLSNSLYGKVKLSLRK